MSQYVIWSLFERRKDQSIDLYHWYQDLDTENSLQILLYLLVFRIHVTYKCRFVRMQIFNRWLRSNTSIVNRWSTIPTGNRSGAVLLLKIALNSLFLSCSAVSGVPGTCGGRTCSTHTRYAVSTIYYLRRFYTSAAKPNADWIDIYTGTRHKS